MQTLWIQMYILLRSCRIHSTRFSSICRKITRTILEEGREARHCNVSRTFPETKQVSRSHSLQESREPPCNSRADSRSTAGVTQILLRSAVPGEALFEMPDPGQQPAGVLGGLSGQGDGILKSHGQFRHH